MSTKIIISVNKTRVQTKKEGEFITGFSVKAFDLETDVKNLEYLFQNNLYSTNSWGNPKPKDLRAGYRGSSKAENYIGMYGITLDIDEPGLTISQAQEQFKDYKYILHTSSGHQVDKPEKGGIIDRYRIILPFEPRYNDEPWFVNSADAERFYAFLKWKYPYADRTVFERARKCFPFAGEDRSKYQFICHPDGKYISFTLDEIKAGIVMSQKEEIRIRANEILERKKVEQEVFDSARQLEQNIENHQRQQINVTDGKPYYSPTGEEYVMPDEIIKARINNNTTSMPFQQLKEYMLFNDIDKVPVFCNHCDDINSQSASAFVYKDMRGFFNVECSHCRAELEKKMHGQPCDHRTRQHRWREYPVSGASFAFNNKIYEIKIKGTENIAPHELGREEWKYKDEADYAFQYIKKERYFITSNFTINYFSDPALSASIPSYQLSFKQNAIDITYPITKSDIEDNAFIDEYLDNTFGEHSEFIKDWMAMFVYTNYASLPVLVFAGSRGSGKNTFVQMIGDIYPMLWAQWSGDQERFNSYYSKKLLWIDENAFGDKRSQYDEIKYLTGNQYVTVEEKYQPRYRMKNNIKVILTTNDFKPLSVKNDEAPKSEMDNNFFFFEFQPLDPDHRDRQLGEKLQQRIGYYARTELKRRYDNIIANLDPRCRYMIRCPITQYAKKIYVMAKTEVEIAIDEISDQLIRNRTAYIKMSGLKQILQDNGYRNLNAKQVLSEMQHIGILSMEEHRDAVSRKGFRVLPVPDIDLCEADE